MNKYTAQNNGARSAPAAPQILVPRSNTHTPLPNGVSKTEAIGTVAKALQAMALPQAAIAAWRLIADRTESVAWVSDAETPMNYRKAKDLARDLGVTDRHWRRLECQLENAGVIFRATTENGFRGKAARGAVTFGLSLEPALANYAELEALSKRPEREERARKLCLATMRATRKRLNALASFDPLTENEQRQLEALEQAYRPTRPGFAPESELKAYLDQLSRFEEQLRARTVTSVQSAPPALTESGHMADAPEGAVSEPVRNAPPCPNGAAQPEQTSTKMSDAADSDVRCQYNLEYKYKRLNACSASIQKNEEPMKVVHNHKGSRQTPPAQAQVQTKPSKHDPGTGQLPKNHRIDLTIMHRVYDYPLILEDIKREKGCSPCDKLDPQHIWDRFRRYNLKRDKHILPIAALRAFIKGWIVDKPQAYAAGGTGQGGYTPQTHTSRGLGSAVTPQAPLHSREDVLDYYAALLRSGKFIPQTMISPSLMRELLETGRISN